MRHLKTITVPEIMADPDMIIRGQINALTKYVAVQGFMKYQKKKTALCGTALFMRKLLSI